MGWVNAGTRSEAGEELGAGTLNRFASGVHPRRQKARWRKDPVTSNPLRLFT